MLDGLLQVLRIPIGQPSGDSSKISGLTQGFVQDVVNLVSQNGASSNGGSTPTPDDAQGEF